MSLGREKRRAEVRGVEFGFWVLDFGLVLEVLELRV